MIINNNISSLISYNSISRVDKSLNKSIEKLSSGMRINRACDDAAGLAISEKMRSQIRSLEVAKRNTQDGISLLQTAEGALSEIHNNLQRLRELNIQATNGIYNDTDKDNLQVEADLLLKQISAISSSTNFNGVVLLDSSLNATLQIGITEDSAINLTGIDATLNKMGLNTIDITDAGNLETIEDAINHISTSRATLGGIQNRLEHNLSSLINTHENLSVAESRIRDVDMAKEMAKYSASQVILKAGMAIAAQANSKSAMITKLL